MKLLSFKKGDITLETIVRYVLLAIVAAVLIYFIYAFLVKGIGHGTIKPLVDRTSKESGSKLKDLFS